MEKNIDVMRKSLELSETVIEGLKHVQKLLIDGQLNDTIYLIDDIILAFTTIEKSIRPILEKLSEQTALNLTDDVKLQLESVVITYETNDQLKAQGEVQTQLLPKFKEWNEQLIKAFGRYVLS